jgi:hypothetical protein
MRAARKASIQAPHHQNSYTDYELYIQAKGLGIWALNRRIETHTANVHTGHDIVFTDYVNQYAHIDWNVWCECQSSIGWQGIMRLLAVECGVSHDRRSLGSLQYTCSVTRLHNITYT